MQFLNTLEGAKTFIINQDKKKWNKQTYKHTSRWMGFQSKAEDDYEKGKYKKKKVDFMQRIFESLLDIFKKHILP